MSSISESGRSPGEGNGNQFQYFAWRIPCTEEPGGQQSMGSQRVGRDSATNTFTNFKEAFVGSNHVTSWCE